MSLESILSYFGVNTPGEVVFDYRVNNRMALDAALRKGAMIVEFDVSDRYGTGNPVVAHPYAKMDGIGFEEMIDELVAAGTGMKLDLKSPSIMQQSLSYVRQKNGKFPVFINAEIVEGIMLGGGKPAFNPSEFVEAVNGACPDALVSLSWTSSTQILDSGQYTNEMVDEMLEIAALSRSPVTICIRACYLERSQEVVQRIVKETPHTLTVWRYPTDLKDDTSVRKLTDPEITFYQIPYFQILALR